MTVLLLNWIRPCFCAREVSQWSPTGGVGLQRFWSLFELKSVPIMFHVWRKPCVAWSSSIAKAPRSSGGNRASCTGSDVMTCVYEAERFTAERNRNVPHAAVTFRFSISCSKAIWLFSASLLPPLPFLSISPSPTLSQTRSCSTPPSVHGTPLPP